MAHQVIGIQNRKNVAYPLQRDQLVFQLQPLLQVLRIKEGRILYSKHHHFTVVPKFLDKIFIIQKYGIIFGQEGRILIGHLDALRLERHKQRQNTQNDQYADSVSENDSGYFYPHNWPNKRFVVKNAANLLKK